MPINSITHNPHLKKLRRSILDEALGITPRNVAITLDRAEMLNMSQGGYEEMMHRYPTFSQKDQDQIATKIIQWYLGKMKADIVSKELYLRMLVTQHTTSSNSWK